MSLQKAAPDLVLASRSPARIALLSAAGLRFATQAADVDEAALRANMDKRSPQDVATALAVAKAQVVGAGHGGSIVIGADQVLELDGEILSKPADRDAAAAQLARLAGRTHRLHSACACYVDGAIRWQTCDSATLTMRPLSEAFITRYLDAAGDDVFASVGAYQLEGLGAHLFEAVEGDYFTILGLPLLPLLDFLRAQGAIQR